MIKELKKFKEDTSKHLNEWKWVFKNRSRNKLLTEVLEHTNEWLDEIAKTMQDLKTEISKKIEILKKVPTEMKIEMKFSPLEIQPYQQVG